MNSGVAGAGDRSTEVLVIGSGIAGLTFALKAARDHSVLLVTKKDRAASNTNYARGGIAAVVGPDDRLELHRADTFVAGSGLCHPDAVRTLVSEGPHRVRELVEWGAAFRSENGYFDLGREGGHSRRRIVNAGDQTGREIESALLQAIEASPAIRVLENHRVIDLVTSDSPVDGAGVCRGGIVLDIDSGEIVEIESAVTMLATGGCGQVYRHTTNPAIATGDGVAMAYRAGARVGNMEFVQFHPTALFPTEDPAFLISEALRGEGAVLRRSDGTAFMDDYHEEGSLAPRDVVARAIDEVLRETGEACVWLDISAIPTKRLEDDFASTVHGCEERGLDPKRDGIPVVPAAHYECGGVFTDLDGRTSVRNLYASGEVACTGVHGANRLASNSLLEAVVFSHRAARDLRRQRRVEAAAPERASTPPSPAEPLPKSITEPMHLRRELRDLMWSCVGIVRSDEGLEEARDRLHGLRSSGGASRLVDVDANGPHLEACLETRNLLDTGALIVRCAEARKESRGLHFNRDHPHRDNERHLRDTVVQRAGFEDFG